MVGDEVVLPGFAAIYRITGYHYNGSGRVELHVEQLRRDNTWDAYSKVIALTPSCYVIRTHRLPTP